MRPATACAVPAELLAVCGLGTYPAAGHRSPMAGLKATMEDVIGRGPAVNETRHPPAVPALEHVSRHQDAELHELRDNLLRAAGIEPRVLPKVHGTGKPVKVDPHARECGPSPLSEESMAALRAYVGQNDAIDGTWDPMTCTLTKPAASQPDSTAEPEPEDDPAAQALAAEREAARLKKAEKARKKREKKKAAKKRAQGKTELVSKPPGSRQAGSLPGMGPGDKVSWEALGAPTHAPTPAAVRPEKPISQEDQLRSLGFGRLERERVQTFQRLQRLTGLAEQYPELNEGENPMGPSIAQQLEEYVERAGKIKEIVEAREICARLCNIADDLIAEVGVPDISSHDTILAR